jgi:integrase
MCEPDAAYDSERLFNNSLSSTPLCFSLFGPMVRDLNLATSVFRTLLGDDFVERVEKFSFETAPLGRRSAAGLMDRTAFDLAVHIVSADGQRGTIFIEVKYSESMEGPAARMRDRYNEASKEVRLTTDDVLAVLKPIWTTKAETASRLRGRIEKVLDAAKAKGFREGENPARWRGHLDHLLPKRPKLTRGHHAAMPYEEVPAFIGRLRETDSLGAQALELCILTAARSGEILGMQWNEVDLERRLWTLPADRMKAGREHRVPLSTRAVSILRGLHKLKSGKFVFPGQVRGKSLSNMAMEMVLRRMKLQSVTVHGFRSSFRDWAGNVTNFPREVTETALSHVLGDKAEQAYRRSDALDKRRKLMDTWSAYCEPKTSANVVQMHNRNPKRG